jgi:hypothetical protein
MNKPFDIHDWQAKQRQQLLKENFANQKYYDLLNDLRDEGHLHRYGVIQLQMQFGLKEKEAQEIYSEYIEDLKAEQPDAADFYLKDLNENMYIDDDEFERENLEFDIKRYIGQTFASWMSPSNPPFAQEYAKSPYIDDLAKGISDVVLKRYKTRMEEHHAGDYKPGFLKQTVEKFLDKLKEKTDEGKDYETVEKIMEKHFSAKKKNEASMTGTGASVTTGTGAAYATPKAFGDDKNKKKKAYMGYKEI